MPLRMRAIGTDGMARVPKLINCVPPVQRTISALMLSKSVGLDIRGGGGEGGGCAPALKRTRSYENDNVGGNA